MYIRGFYRIGERQISFISSEQYSYENVWQGEKEKSKGNAIKQGVSKPMALGSDPSCNVKERKETMEKCFTPIGEFSNEMENS